MQEAERAGAMLASHLRAFNFGDGKSSANARDDMGMDHVTLSSPSSSAESSLESDGMSLLHTYSCFGCCWVSHRVHLL